MALPNKQTRTIDPRRRKRTASKHGGIKILLLLLPFLIYAFIFYRTSIDFAELENAADTPPAEKTMDLLTLPDEAMFSKTLKQCLPAENRKCKTYVPENSGHRIALLAPPGDMTKSFSKVVEHILNSAKHQTKDGIDIEWIPTTHMAPYGYGKTHGLTKIIRIVPEPLLLGATDTLLHQTIGASLPSHEDIEASLRQQIRYHCRLNHIAAHTSLWTLRWKELSSMPMETLVLQIQEYLDVEPQSHGVLAEEMASMILNQKSSVSEIANEGLKVLKNIEGIGRDFNKAFNSVLLNELQISKNLTAWPCQSFWTVGKPPDQLQVSPSISQIAKGMSPNCTSPINTCWVKRDKCEADGDGECA